MDTRWTNQYEAAVSLLKQLQADYRSSREELEDVSLRFAEREVLAGQQLRSTLEEAEKMASSDKPGASTNEPAVGSQHVLIQAGELPDTVKKQSRPTLQVFCLGTFQIRVDGKAIQYWRSIKAKSLLKYLINQQGKPTSKDTLMEVLWPGYVPQLANNNLKTTVRFLRQTLSSAINKTYNLIWVLFQDGNYLINKDVNLWLDVDQFEYHWHTGRQLEKQSKLAEAISEYKAAEKLYQGDYLRDDLYEDWTSLRREALKDIFLSILGRLAEYAMQNELYQDCIAYCQKILVEDRCHEDAYRYLMCCYSRLGQRNRAISWYHLAEKNIKSELDISPDNKTRAIYQKLLNGEEYV